MYNNNNNNNNNIPNQKENVFQYNSNEQNNTFSKKGLI